MLESPFRIGPSNELGFLLGGTREETIYRRADCADFKGS